MLRYLHHKVRGLPTPVAGLALGIASLGWCLENAFPLHGVGQNVGALIAGLLLAVLAIRFIFHPDTLTQDLKHPVVGSIVPTFAMAAMVVSKALGNFMPTAGQMLWLGAVIVHLVSLSLFIYHRAKEPKLHHLVPSWFVPPVGIIVADVTCPSEAYTEFALILLAIGATALYKMANLVGSYPQAAEYAHQLHMMATVEAVIATLVIGYVSVRFIHNYLLPQRLNVHQGMVK